MTPGPIAPETVTATLSERFGFDTLKPGQARVIDDVLAGRPTLAVMPTGAGKSLCYPRPAVLLDGLTLVVSPLIALMKDQVDALQARGIAAGCINSTLSSAEQSKVLGDALSGRLDLLYVAPERFGVPSFARAMREADIALFAVDEAHCISQWGHDFRPDYKRLGAAMGELSPQRVLACTATATDRVRTDIVETLGLQAPSVHVAGFLRDNLFLDVQHCAGDHQKLGEIKALLTEGPGADGGVIVYCATRKHVERVASALGSAVDGGVVGYHAGMDGAARDRAQERFVSGAARVAVATNAFGMGVDRSDVRAVVHYDMPSTIEAYYQEVGRAGRDGQPSYALLTASSQDARLQEFFVDMSYPPRALLDAVWEVARAQAARSYLDVDDIADRVQGESAAKVESALRVLARSDALALDDRRVLVVPDAPADVDDLGLDLRELYERRQHEVSMLRQMRGFAHHDGCRHQAVLAYFGDELSVPCPGCDQCHRSERYRRASTAGPPGEPTEAETLLVRKALSGVARARGRYGLKSVADMLAGSKAKRIVDGPLGRLSTYGLLSDTGATAVATLLRWAVDVGLCRIAGGEYPLIDMTDEGQAVMAGRASLSERPPLSGASAASRSGRGGTKRAPSPSAPLSDDAAARLERLRAWRSEQASATGRPPYTFFDNRAMEALARAAPHDRTSFLAVHGMGPGRWSSYGETIVALLRGDG